MNENTKPQAGPSTAVSTAPKKSDFKPLSQCNTLMEAFATREIKERIGEAIPKHMNPDAMLRAFIQAASKTPLIYECDLRQSIGAFLSLSYLGLTPGTALNHCHLIPFKSSRWNRTNRAFEDCVDLNVIIGYPGYVELAHRSGLISSIHADVVLPGEHFRAEHGTHKLLEHRPELDHDTEGQTPRAAYAFVNMQGEGDQFEVMPWFDVLKIRNRSQAYQRALKAKEEAEAGGKRIPKTWTEAPWVRDEREMGKKTPFRRLAKWLPKCPELRAATSLEDAQDHGRLNYGAVIDGTATPLDGIPEAEDDPPPVDPGTAHGIRSSSTTPKTEQPKPKPKPAATATATTSKREPSVDPEPPDEGRFGPTNDAPAGPAPNGTIAWNDDGFEAMLIDANGEPTSDQAFQEPSAFASALLALWRDGQNRAALLEHNADAIAEASTDAVANSILEEMDDEQAEAEPAQKTAATPSVPVVQPPMERGKVSWASYVKLVKQALMQVDQNNFGVWAAAQRDTLEKCPMAQRVLCVRAISETAGMRRIDPPLWLADLIKPREVEAPGESKPDTAPGLMQSVDERWVDARIADLASIHDRASFDLLTTSLAVQTVMARLRRENRQLFDKADKAFDTKHRALPSVKDGAP